MPTLDEMLQNDFEDEEVFTSLDGYQELPYEDNEVIFIDQKQIGSLESQISVSGEENAQYIVFQRSRYVDGIDIIDKLIQIHYEREDGVGDNCPVVNVQYSDEHIRFGWVIPRKAVAIEGVLKVMPFAIGASPSGESYVLKEIYSEYTVHEGLAIDGGIEEPDEEWYTQFLTQMQSFLTQAINAKNDAESYKDSAAQSASQALESRNSAQTSAAAASQHETNAQAAKDASVQAASQAQQYYSQTRTLSITNVGNITFAIDPIRNCLTATYNEEDE